MSEEQVDLEVQVGEWLRKQGLRLVTAESCTGGLIGDRVTDVPGSSDYYLGGIISYANEAKQRLLGVQRKTLESYGAVSMETVIEMASGARAAFSQDFPMEQLVGLSVSGVAGPGGGTPEKPVGLVWIGLSTPEGDQAWKFIWDGSRQENKALSAAEALKILLAYLQGREPK